MVTHSIIDERLTAWVVRHGPFLVVSAGPFLLLLFVLLGPFLTSPLITYSGASFGVGGQIFRGAPSIDPNIATTAFALGQRAALDIVSGQLPLWNHYQGFGAPLLGEMQSAALFPPTLLLLLPSGQALEHIFLQWVAGAGAYLFFRKFGLGATAAVVGAVIYEFNGVFATLRNAAYNPVAFLPWLMFGVEALRANLIGKESMTERLASIALTAVAGASALYAGFPETAYLYGLLVVVWGVYRLIGLSIVEARNMLVGLAAAVALALLIGAPLLVAFFTFLPEADVGGHGEEFVGMVQQHETAVLYFMPYLYGLFVASTDEVIGGLSISSGGYIAFAPVLLAAASLWVPGYRAVKTVLCAWIVVALGASHGWPIIHELFTALPLMELAVPGRYLNASWIFCTAFLASLAVERLVHLGPRERRRAAFGALATTAALFAVAVFPALEMLPRAWASVRPAFAASLLLAGVAIAGALAAIRASSAGARIVAFGIVGVEAATLFIVPYIAYPRSGTVDHEAIAFLRENVGFQRVAKSDGYGLSANFGAAFGVPLIHFDDLPSPLRTIEYLKTHVDPYAGSIFLPESPSLGRKELEERRRVFRERLGDYADVGVKYVMAAPDFYAEPALSFVHRDERPIILDENQVFRVESRIENAIELDALTLRISTFRNTTTGSLSARLCAGDSCSHGETDFSTADDGRLMLIRLDAPVALEAGTTFSLEFQKRGPTAGVIWTYPAPAGAPAMNVRETPRKVEAGYNVELAFIPASRPKPVHASRSMSFFELENVRPYASAPGCKVTLRSFDAMETSCTKPSRLTRLTVLMNGWRAEVNGTSVPIGLTDETFQTIDLPVGKALVSFSYAPPWFQEAAAAALAALAFIIASFALAVRRRRQNSADVQQALP